jgi:hypothetical protein
VIADLPTSSCGQFGNCTLADQVVAQLLASSNTR